MADRGIHPSVGSPSGHDDADAAASERITGQLGRLIPLVNGPARIAGVNRSVCTASLASLLSWDDDGQLAVD
ncbi:hypothetical protein KBZ14_10575 [Synechococcus sp. HJ21-Hayes]|jgi:hypothetical protein|uniref:hypothetical protein n=1 Tax=unclassified Synechococcus TaxID=2626047 RepID=UPI0020CCB541|nr:MULTISPECIES: hypothetical protein [unclassified Synechococcus]MCP9831119.1 hypothetical protein [Synechococcus sp. JJ3a-Johnson]MCP9853306.1 hypothetical protein [Synechococcus sp. HJ21-Hayes]